MYWQIWRGLHLAFQCQFNHHLSFHVCVPPQWLISFWTWHSNMRKKAAQRAQRQTIRRHRLLISVIDGCWFGSKCAFHDYCAFGCVGVVGTVRVWEQWHHPCYMTCRYSPEGGCVASKIKLLLSFSSPGCGTVCEWHVCGLSRSLSLTPFPDCLDKLQELIAGSSMLCPISKAQRHTLLLPESLRLS